MVISTSCQSLSNQLAAILALNIANLPQMLSGGGSASPMAQNAISTAKSSHGSAVRSNPTVVWTSTSTVDRGVLDAGVGERVPDVGDDAASAEDDRTCGKAELPDNPGPSRVEQVRVDLYEPTSTTPT